MLDSLAKELSLVKVSIEEKEKELDCAKTSIVGLENANEALESNISSLKVQNQELQVQFDDCKISITSSLEVNSFASSSNTSTCKHCSKYNASYYLTNHARKDSSKVEVKQILKKFSSNDGLSKVEPKYKPLRNNNGKWGLGYYTFKVNPSIEHKGWRSPKFIASTTLYGALGRI
jgi:chromosome segregation ATPase